MAGQYLDPEILKDEVQSTHSSMNDSAYMSQADVSHLHGPIVNMQYRTTQDSAQSGTQGFINPDMLSPTLSSTSHGTFYAQQGAQNYRLPSSAMMNGSSSMMPQFANMPNQMFFGQSNFDNREAMTSPFSPVSAEGHRFWNGQQRAQQIYPANRAAVPQYNAMHLNMMTAPIQQHQPIAQRPQIRRQQYSSLSEPSMSSATINRPASAKSQVTTAQRAVAASPATSVASQLVAYPPANHTADTFSYIDYEAGEETLENSASASLIASSVTSETGAEGHGRIKTRIVRPTDDAAARSDPLYSCGPGADDMYHCPFAHAEECGHKPTKLKCNYDKYIDSHLKPFRCKHVSCTEVQFSSTACLLRHEREAHGMHGHGSKPNLCLYQDCERSQPGNGFPRRYNLYDHMRRVHDYTGPTASPDEHVISPDHIQPPKKGVKRKGSEEVVVRAEKPRKVSRVMAPPQSKREKELQSLNMQWTQRISSLQQRVQGVATLTPGDVTLLEQINEDVNALQRISQQFNELG